MALHNTEQSSVNFLTSIQFVIRGCEFVAISQTYDRDTLWSLSHRL